MCRPIPFISICVFLIVFSFEHCYVVDEGGGRLPKSIWWKGAMSWKGLGNTALGYLQHCGHYKSIWSYTNRNENLIHRPKTTLLPMIPYYPNMELRQVDFLISSEGWRMDNHRVCQSLREYSSHAIPRGSSNETTSVSCDECAKARCRVLFWHTFKYYFTSFYMTFNYL